MKEFRLTGEIKEKVLKLMEKEISEKMSMSITPVKNGFNVRIKAKKIIKSVHSFRKILIKAGKNPFYCVHCYNFTIVENDPHHIIYKSAGGRDIPENGIFLCRGCHNMIHIGAIYMEHIIGEEEYERVKKLHV